MTHDGRRSYSRNSNRIVRCLLGWTVGVVLASGPVEAGPVDQTRTDASVAAGARQSSSFGERRARWLAISNSIDSRKWERIWLCMRFKDAPMDFPEALNICEPCVSALATAGVRPAVLTDREKSCIKGRTGDGSGADAGPDSGAGKYDAAVNPQCSGTSPIGARADEPTGNIVRPMTRAEVEAHRELVSARENMQQANAAVRNAQADIEWYRQQGDRENVERARACLLTGKRTRNGYGGMTLLSGPRENANRAPVTKTRAVRASGRRRRGGRRGRTLAAAKTVISSTSRNATGA
jgi:hypothetical protein